MSGETEADISGWTVDTLNSKFERVVRDLERKLDERYAQQTKAVEAAFMAQKTAMEAAFIAQKTAMETAFTAADKAVDRALVTTNMALDKRTDTLDREFHEHLAQVRHENALAFVNSDKAIAAALTSQKEAVSKAEAATEKRFESVNEFRAQLDDQASRFMPRSEATAQFDRLSDQIDSLKERIDKSEGHGLGATALAGWVVAALTLIISVVVAINLVTGSA